MTVPVDLAAAMTEKDAAAAAKEPRAAVPVMRLQQLFSRGEAATRAGRPLVNSIAA